MSLPRPLLALVSAALCLASSGLPPALAQPNDPANTPRLRDVNVPLTEEVQKQLDALAAGVQAAPQDAVKRADYGLALTRVGKVREGLVELRKAAAQAPDEPKVQLMLARGLWKAGEIDPAIAAALRAAKSPLASRHDQAEAYRVAGTSAWEAARSAEAEEYFKSGLEREPTNAPLHLSYSSLLLNQRRNAEAYQQLDAAVRDAKEVRVLHQTAQLLGHLGRHEMARVAWNRIVEMTPEDPVALKQAAMHEFRFENYPRTIELIERSIRLKPGDGEAHLVYAQALLRSHRHEEADREARLAEKLGAGQDATATIEEIRIDKANGK